MKTIIISEETHKRLAMIKLDYDFKKFNEAIIFLLEKFDEENKKWKINKNKQ